MTDMRAIYDERASRGGITHCPLCRSLLAGDKDKRGVVEFMDGWFWVCSKCLSILGKPFDCKQQADYGQHEVIPYCKRSRKFVLKWLEKGYQIKVGA